VPVPVSKRKPPGNSIADLGVVVTIAGGLASLVYVVGGLVLAARLTLYALPTEAVVVQIPQWALLAVGLTEVVLPTLGIVFVFGLYRLIWRAGLFQDAWRLLRVVPPLQRIRGSGSWRWMRVHQAAPRIRLVVETLVAALFTYVVFAVSRPNSFTGREGLSLLSLPALPLPFLNSYVAILGVFVVVVVAAAFAGAIANLYVRPQIAWIDFREARKMVAIVTVLTMALMTLFAMTIPLLDVKVCRKGGPPVTGWLVATSSDRLYIGQQTASVSEPRYIESVPLSDATDVFISGRAESTPCAV
jgi:hypothetical protein